MYNQENRPTFFTQMFTDITFWIVPLALLGIFAIGHTIANGRRAQMKLETGKHQELLDKIDKLEKQLNAKNK